MVDLEGDASCQEFVHHHSQRPDVHLPVVTVPQEELGRDVERSPAESVTAVSGTVH